MVNVFGEVKGFVVVLDLELAARHVCCVIEFYLKIIEKQLIDLAKHILVHFELMQVDSPFCLQFHPRS